MEWVSQTEAARRLRIKKQKITKWINDGNIKRRSDSKIDLDEAKKIYEQGKILNKRGNGNFYSDLSDARRARESWQAKLLELDFKQREGELLERDEVEFFIKSIISTAKTKILAVADRVPPLIIGDENEKRIRKIIRDELIIALQELTKLKNYKK
jgi:GAF domain-containing protein